MSETNRPHLLARLRARTLAHAAGPHGARIRRAAAIGGLVALALLGGYHLWHRTDGGVMPGLVAGELPACDAPLARDLLRQAVEGQATALTGPFRVQSVGDVMDHGATVRENIDAMRPTANDDPEVFRRAVQGLREAEAARRTCSAQVFTSRGVRVYGYALSWTSPAREEVYLEAVRAE